MGLVHQRSVRNVSLSLFEQAILRNSTDNIQLFRFSYDHADALCSTSFAELIVVKHRNTHTRMYKSQIGQYASQSRCTPMGLNFDL